MAKRFMYVALGIFAVAAAYHLGAAIPAIEAPHQLDPETPRPYIAGAQEAAADFGSGSSEPMSPSTCVYCRATPTAGASWRGSACSRYSDTGSPSLGLHRHLASDPPGHVFDVETRSIQSFTRGSGLILPGYT